MQARMLLFLFVSLLLVAGTYPEPCSAKDKQASVKSKSKKRKSKRKRKRRKAEPAPVKRVMEDPYASEGEAQGENVDEKPETAGGISEALEESKEESQGVISETSTGKGSLRRSGRMEFDERLIKGQAAKSGAVYLFKRVPRRLPGLVPMRRSYRKRIVEPVLGSRKLKPAKFSKKKETKKDKAPLKPEDKIEIIELPVSQEEAAKEEAVKEEAAKQDNGGNK